MTKKKVTKKKRGGIAGKPSIMRRQRFYMDIAIRCAELAACDIDIGASKSYKIGRREGMNEVIRIFYKHYGKK